jgi:thiol-disulfide isomerase/thioredoxin
MNAIRSTGQRLSLLAIPLIAVALAGTAPRAAPVERPHPNFILHDAPRPLPALPFTDGDGKPMTLDAFRGMVVLLNLWATWCGPCRKEMPTLDRLQAALGGPDFEVIALSIDRPGLEPVRKFYAEIGIRNLALYNDSSGKAAITLNAFGLPATLLIDRQGRELGRLIGPAEWDTSEMIDFLKGVVSNRTRSLMPRPDSRTVASTEGGEGPASHPFNQQQKDQNR